MGLANIGWSGLVLILVALILVFGPSKLPEIGRSIGKSLSEFKSAAGGKSEAKESFDSAQVAVESVHSHEKIETKE